MLVPDSRLDARPTPYSAGGRDAAPFDSVPGAGFDTSAMAAAIVPPRGRLNGTGAHLAIDPRETNAFRALNAAWQANATVGRRGDRYIISGLSTAAMTELVTSLAISGECVAEPGEPVRKPRIALFEPPNSMDAGWTRWVLERYGFEFIGVTGADITGTLKGRVDVLLVGDEARGVLSRGGVQGRQAAGAPAAPDEERIRALEDFVRAGGTLVALNRAATAVIDQLKLPVRNVLGGLGRQQFFAGGSVLRVLTEPSQPVMAGMPKEADIFVSGGPAFETVAGFDGAVLAAYPAEGSPLRSGYLLGEHYLQGKAAAVDARLGDGRVVLLGFRPQWRGQTFGTFRVLFNSLLR